MSQLSTAVWILRKLHRPSQGKSDQQSCWFPTSGNQILLSQWSSLCRGLQSVEWAGGLLPTISPMRGVSLFSEPLSSTCQAEKPQSPFTSSSLPPPLPFPTIWYEWTEILIILPKSCVWKKDQVFIPSPVNSSILLKFFSPVMIIFSLYRPWYFQKPWQWVII